VYRVLLRKYEEKDNLQDLDVDSKIILERTLKNIMEEGELDSHGSGWHEVANSFNKHEGSTKWVEILD
jgi:hypothetical protein